MTSVTTYVSENSNLKKSKTVTQVVKNRSKLEIQITKKEIPKILKETVISGFYKSPKEIRKPNSSKKPKIYFAKYQKRSK